MLNKNSVLNNNKYAHERSKSQNSYYNFQSSSSKDPISESQLIPDSNFVIEMRSQQKERLVKLKLSNEKAILTNKLFEMQNLNGTSYSQAKNNWESRLKPLIEKLVHDSNKLYNEHIWKLEYQIEELELERQAQQNMVNSLKLDLEDKLKYGMVEILSKKIEERSQEFDKEKQTIERNAQRNQEQMIMWQDKYESLEKNYSDFMNDQSNDYQGLKHTHGGEIVNYQEKLNKAETQVIEYNFLTKNLRKENAKWLQRIFVSEKELQSSREEIINLKQKIEQMIQENPVINTINQNQSKNIQESPSDKQVSNSIQSDEMMLSQPRQTPRSEISIENQLKETPKTNTVNETQRFYDSDNQNEEVSPINEYMIKNFENSILFLNTKLEDMTKCKEIHENETQKLSQELSTMNESIKEKDDEILRITGIQKVIEEKVESAGQMVVDTVTERIELKEQLEEQRKLYEAFKKVHMKDNVFLEQDTSEKQMESILFSHQDNPLDGSPPRNNRNFILNFRNKVEKAMPSHYKDDHLRSCLDNILEVAVREYSKIFEELQSSTIKLESNQKKINEYLRLLNLSKSNIVLLMDEHENYTIKSDNKVTDTDYELTPNVTRVEPTPRNVDFEYNDLRHSFGKIDRLKVFEDGNLVDELFKLQTEIKILTDENHVLSKHIQMLQGVRISSSETLGFSQRAISDQAVQDENQKTGYKNNVDSKKIILELTISQQKSELLYQKTEFSNTLREKDTELLKLQRDIQHLKKKNKFLINKFSDIKLISAFQDSQELSFDEKDNKKTKKYSLINSANQDTKKKSGSRVDAIKEVKIIDDNLNSTTKKEPKNSNLVGLQKSDKKTLNK